MSREGFVILFWITLLGFATGKIVVASMGPKGGRGWFEESGELRKQAAQEFKEGLKP